MARHPFLSDAWIEAARQLRAEHAGAATGLEVQLVRANLVVRDVPFGDGALAAHLDTSSGAIDLETGHLEDPDATVTLEYEVAKAVFVGGDPQALLQAFMGGRIKVDGDLAKLLALQAVVPPPTVVADATTATHRLRDITE